MCFPQLWLSGHVLYNDCDITTIRQDYPRVISENIHDMFTVRHEQNDPYTTQPDPDISNMTQTRPVTSQTHAKLPRYDQTRPRHEQHDPLRSDMHDKIQTRTENSKTTCLFYLEDAGKILGYLHY